MQVIGLTRVSTDAQAGSDRAGLASQRAECERIARVYGLTVAEWVVLDGVSGAAVREDARFRRLLDRLAEPGIGGVIVAEMSRLMRPASLDDYAILAAFARAGAILYTADGPRDVRDFGGRLLALLQGELAAEERRAIRARTMRAKERHRADGRHVLGPRSLPYGVAYSREAGWSYTWPEAERVRALYAAVLAGETDVSALARRVGLARSHASKALRNPIYAGLRRYEWRAIGRRRVRRAPEEVLEVPVLAEPLVSRESWEAVQRLLAERPAPVRHADAPALYHGLAACVACGRPLHVHRERHGSPPWSYRCRQPGEGCVGQIMARYVDAAADDALGAALGSPRRLEALLTAAIDAGAFLAPAGAGPSPGELAARREAIARERERVLLSWERGLRDEGAALARLAALDADAAALAGLEPVQPAEEDVYALAAHVARVFGSWGARAPGERRRLARVALRSLAAQREGRARVRVASVDLWWPAPSPPVPHVERRGAAAGVGWVRLELAA